MTTAHVAGPTPSWLTVDREPGVLCVPSRSVSSNSWNCDWDCDRNPELPRPPRPPSRLTLWETRPIWRATSSKSGPRSPSIPPTRSPSRATSERGRGRDRGGRRSPSPDPSSGPSASPDAVAALSTRDPGRPSRSPDPPTSNPSQRRPILVSGAARASRRRSTSTEEPDRVSLRTGAGKGPGSVPPCPS